MASSLPARAAAPEPIPLELPVRRDRIAVLDAARGFALALMVLDHASTFARVNVNAETYADRVTTIWGPGWFAVGLLTNVSSPLFWFIAGASIALLAGRARRARDVDRFLLVRAGLLVALDQLVVRPEWSPLHPRWAFEFDLLTCLGVTLLALVLLRRLPGRALALATGALLVGYAALVRLVPQAALERLPDLARMLVTYDRFHPPLVAFPVLGWLPLTMLGLLAGRRLADGRWLGPRPFVRLGLGALAIGLVVRLASVGSWRGGGLAAFLRMSKGPPALDYLAINLALGLLTVAALWSLRPRADRAPWSWLVAWGQAPLFLFIAHLPIAFAWGRVFRHALPHADATRYALTVAASLATLLPLARWYRRVKQQHRETVLRYC